MSQEIKKRIFLVGCPRSGTTLLQSLIATQPPIMSFPETHFFGLPGSGRRHFLALRFGYVPAAMRRRMRGRLQVLLGATGQAAIAHHFPGRSHRLQSHVDAFVTILDMLTRKRGKSFWLEKTPSHLYFVDVIERTIPDVHFIHLVRNGPDVIASLFEVTQQYPAAWNGEYNIDRCISRWHRDVQLSQRHLRKPNHLLVKYEHLIESPEYTLGEICSFIGFAPQPELIDHHRTVAGELIATHEKWKETARRRIRNVHREKFGRVFDANEQAYILRRVKPLDI